MGVELVTDEQYCKKALGDAYAVPLDRTAGRAAGCAVSFAWVRALHIPVHSRLQRCGHPTRFLFIFFFSAARVSPARYFGGRRASTTLLSTCSTNFHLLFSRRCRN